MANDFAIELPDWVSDDKAQQYFETIRSVGGATKPVEIPEWFPQDWSPDTDGNIRTATRFNHEMLQRDADRLNQEADRANVPAANVEQYSFPSAVGATVLNAAGDVGKGLIKLPTSTAIKVVGSGLEAVGATDYGKRVYDEGKAVAEAIDKAVPTENVIPPFHPMETSTDLSSAAATAASVPFRGAKMIGDMAPELAATGGIAGPAAGLARNMAAASAAFAPKAIEGSVDAAKAEGGDTSRAARVGIVSGIVKAAMMAAPLSRAITSIAGKKAAATAVSSGLVGRIANTATEYLKNVAVNTTAITPVAAMSAAIDEGVRQSLANEDPSLASIFFDTTKPGTTLPGGVVLPAIRQEILDAAREALPLGAASAVGETLAAPRPMAPPKTAAPEAIKTTEPTRSFTMPAWAAETMDVTASAGGQPVEISLGAGNRIRGWAGKRAEVVPAEDGSVSIPTDRGVLTLQPVENGWSAKLTPRQAAETVPVNDPAVPELEATTKPDPVAVVEEAHQSLAGGADMLEITAERGNTIAAQGMPTKNGAIVLETPDGRRATMVRTQQGIGDESPWHVVPETERQAQIRQTVSGLPLADAARVARDRGLVDDHFVKTAEFLSRNITGLDTTSLFTLADTVVGGGSDVAAKEGARGPVLVTGRTTRLPTPDNNPMARVAVSLFRAAPGEKIDVRDLLHEVYHGSWDRLTPEEKATWGDFARKAGAADPQEHFAYTGEQWARGRVNTGPLPDWAHRIWTGIKDTFRRVVYSSAASGAQMPRDGENILAKGIRNDAMSRKSTVDSPAAISRATRPTPEWAKRGVTAEENFKRGNQSLDRMVETKADEPDAMYREETGPISLFWGTPGTIDKEFHNGGGVSHLIARAEHKGIDGIAEARRAIETIAHGEVGPVYARRNGRQRREVRLGNRVAVLALDRHGEDVTWLLTGYEETPDASGQPHGALAGAGSPDLSHRGPQTGAGVDVINDSPIDGKVNRAVRPFDPNTRRQTAAPVDQNITDAVGRQDVVDTLRQGLGFPIRTGGIIGAGRDVLANMKARWGAVRARNPKDVEPVLQALGPAVAARVGLDNQALAPFARELAPWMPKAGPAWQQAPTLQEAFGTFLQKYVTDRGSATTQAPKLLAEFNNRLAGDRALAETLTTATQQYDHYLSQPAQMRIRSEVAKVEGKGMWDTVRQTWDSLYTNLFDNYDPLRRWTEEVTGGAELPVFENPHLLAQLFGGVNGKIATFLNGKPFSFKDPTKLYKQAKSLREVLEPAEGKLSDLDDFLIARRVQEMDAQGRNPTNISRADADAVVAKFPEFDRVAKDLQTYQAMVLRYLVEAGMLSEKAYQAMRKMNREYVPFYRLMGDDAPVDLGGGIGRAFETKSSLVKKIGHSDRQILSPLESVIKNTAAFIAAAERNTVGVAMVELIERTSSSNGEHYGLERIHDSMASKMIDEGLINHLPQNVQEAILKDPKIAAVFRPRIQTPEGELLTVWRKGQREYYKVTDPEILSVLKGMDGEKANIVTKILSFPAKLLRSGAVLTPEFILRNPVIDQVSAFLFTKYGYLPPIDTMKGLLHTLASSKVNGIAKAAKMIGGDADLYWKWMAAGGASAELVALNHDGLSKALKDITGGNEAWNDVSWGRVINPARALMWAKQIAETASETSESVTRVGEFAKGLKEEMASGKGNKAAALAAALSSRNISIDFRRAGVWLKQVNTISAFSNVGFQGLDKLGREWRGAQTVKALAMLTVPTVILALLQKDDPRYRFAPAWTKRMYWVITNPLNRPSMSDWKKMTDEQRTKMMQEAVIRLPKPREIGMVFASLPEEVVNKLYANDNHAFDGFIGDLLDVMTPNVLPTGIVPYMEAKANTSMLTDSAIVPGSREDVEPWAQYSPSTTELAKSIGSASQRIVDGGVSPAIFENTVRGYTGGLGMYALRMADWAVRKSGALPQHGENLPWTAADIPGVKGFIVRSPTMQAQPITDFRKAFRKATQRVKTAGAMKSEGRVDDYIRLKTSNEARVAKLHTINEKINSNSKEAQAIRVDEKMTGQQKKDAIDRLYVESIDLAQMGIELADDIARDGDK